MSDHDDGKKYWLDDAKNVRLLLRVLCGIGLLLVIADLLYHKHAHFVAEETFGFYAFFGFFAFVGIVLAGKHLRKILMRPEDYYDD
jgi:hypothetical protein